MSVELSAHVREEIDRWVAKFPPDRKRSAVIAALHAASLRPQHVRALLLLISDQRQVFRNVFEVDRLRVLNDLGRQHRDRVRRLQQRCRPERSERVE